MHLVCAERYTFAIPPWTRARYIPSQLRSDYTDPSKAGLRALGPIVRGRHIERSHDLHLKAEQEAASAHWQEPGIEAVHCGSREGRLGTRIGLRDANTAASRHCAQERCCV